jgi:hypothetical protein
MKPEYISYLFNIFLALIGIGAQKMQYDIPGIVLVWVGIIGIFVTLLYSFFQRGQIRAIEQRLTELPYNINFIAENTGRPVNSLGRKVILSCLSIPFETKKTKLTGEKIKQSFYIKDDDDTSLQYHSPKKFIAMAGSGPENLYYSNFRKYKFYFGYGMNFCLYFTDVKSKNVSLGEFYLKKFLYRVFKIGHTEIKP